MGAQLLESPNAGRDADLPTRRARVHIGQSASQVLEVAAAPFSTRSIEDELGVISVQIAESLRAENKKKLAVVELTDLSGCVTPLGKLVAQKLTGQLIKAGGLMLVERSKLDEV
ncbi:MAG: hypothetical protein AAF368_16625, partial [Planctomycetota bacterium]